MFVEVSDNNGGTARMPLRLTVNPNINDAKFSAEIEGVKNKFKNEPIKSCSK